MITIRDFQQGDSPYLVKLDHLGSEFPYTIEEWKLVRNFFQDWIQQAVEEDGEVVGFYVAEQMGTRLIIHKLVGRPDVALRACEQIVIDRDMYDMELSVPECSCRGGDDPYDVSGWLKANGFVCDEVIPSMFEAYGELEDGFVFRKKV